MAFGGGGGIAPFQEKDFDTISYVNGQQET